MVFVTFLVFFIINKMDERIGSTSRSGSKASESSNEDDEKKKKLYSKIRRFAVIEVEKFKDKFQNEIVSFPVHFRNYVSDVSSHWFRFPFVINHIGKRAPNEHLQ